MGDADVSAALQSEAQFIVVEAPAGFGKTFQAAEYAKDLLPNLEQERMLILTHTNAACDVFRERTKGYSSRIEMRTIDSLINAIASAYHPALGLPANVHSWALSHQPDGFNKVAEKVAYLLECSPYIARAIACRFPHMVCDEHQDASKAQHSIVMAISKAGARTRIFADPVQMIYWKTNDERGEWDERWNTLLKNSEANVKLDTPHRWAQDGSELGEWLKQVRVALKNGQHINLTGKLPLGLTIFRADNCASHHGQYRLSPNDRHGIDDYINNARNLLVLSASNNMVQQLRAFTNRRLPIWEGHTREYLTQLMTDCIEARGNPVVLAEAAIQFLQSICVGFSNTSYANVLRREVGERCEKSRSGRPCLIQEVAQYIVNFPDHRGVALAIKHLEGLINGGVFSDIKIDLRREFWDAMQLAEFEDIESGMAILNQRRLGLRTKLPSKAISTIHKAKGLERDAVMVLPCDRSSFADTDYKRCLLYVALSRATNSLALVIPHNNPSPLFTF